MKIGFYPRLAVDGFRKNKKLYVPYTLMGSLMTMMFYILCFLSSSPVVSNLPGGDSAQRILSLGPGVLAFFSLIFLFYSNSFLIRRRYHEFGLYNILGMDKKNIGLMMIWESLFVSVIAIGIGLFLGIVLSKLAELGLLNLLHSEISYELHLDFLSIRDTLSVFGGIYLILCINSLLKVRRSKPLELMQSDRIGEKPPKGNVLFALIGIILLAAAYYLALSIEEPLTALTVFFVAVVMVIAATYLIFISASVVFCRLLQKNKKYYYKANHFVSVSSMAYRMKRNGAGLASICILLTMVLVTVSFTASLYFGAEDMINNRYPRDVNVTVYLGDVEKADDATRQSLSDQVIEVAGDPVDFEDCRTAEVSGYFTADGIIIDPAMLNNAGLVEGVIAYENIGTLQVIPLADYNRRMGTDEKLADDECLIYCLRMDYSHDTFAIDGGSVFKVKKVLDEFIPDGRLNMQAIPSMVVVVNDMEDMVAPFLSLRDSTGTYMVQFFWKCGFDMNCADEDIIAVSNEIDAALDDMESEEYIYSGYSESRAGEHAGFFRLFGSLFFIGIVLSIVFLIAAVMIIYYKQISEGYEDRSRFDIMQKVGMTKKEIRKSINSQILTVFSLPIIVAGIHLIFAFPLLWKLLILFNLTDLVFVVIVTLICFAAFALLYVLVYKITSNSYYAIVSNGKE